MLNIVFFKETNQIRLFKYPPFRGNDDNEVAKLAMIVDFEFPDSYVSEEAKDLINKLLVSDPEKRFGINQIKTHRWITQKSSNPLKNSDRSNSILQNKDNLRSSLNMVIDLERQKTEIEQTTPKEKGFNFINKSDSPVWNRLKKK